MLDWLIAPMEDLSGMHRNRGQLWPQALKLVNTESSQQPVGGTG